MSWFLPLLTFYVFVLGLVQFSRQVSSLVRVLLRRPRHD